MLTLSTEFLNNVKTVEPLMNKWIDKSNQIQFNVRVSPMQELVINSFVIASNMYRDLFGKDSYTAMNKITSTGHAYYGKRVELIELFGDDRSKAFVSCLIPRITISDKTTSNLTEFARELMHLTSNPLYLLGDTIDNQYVTSTINRINALTYIVAINMSTNEKIQRDLINEYNYIFYANNIDIDNIAAIDAHLANFD
jgi:hypothetical protein